VAIFCLAGFTQSTSSQSNDALQKELQAVYERFHAAIVARDLDTLMDFYDPKFTLQVEDEVIDRNEIEAIWRGEFRKMDYAFSKATIDKISVTKTGYVIATIKWEYKATQTDKNGKKSVLEVLNKATDIWSKGSDGKWRLFSKEDGGSEGKINGKPLKN
jgi:ketosteroid isomerase-like protein